MTSRRLLWVVIGVSALLHLTWAASLGGFTNEPYYYMYARHLDWGFFDHPPMVGIVAAVGLKLVGSTWPLIGIRLGFIVLFAGSTWLLARLTARAFGERAGVMAALALSATIFYGLKIGTLADPDGALLFFWILTLDRLAVALEAPEKTWVWVSAGLAWGGAMLSKYHAVLLPAGVVLYLVVRPSALRVLKTRGPYLAAVAGAAMFSPVILWNATHGWTSFLYQGNRAGGFHGFQPEMFLEAVVGQILYLTPWIWGWSLAVLYGLFRRGIRNWSAPEAFLSCQALPALVLFLSVATFKRIMPHWPLIGYVALMPLVGRAWADRLSIHPRPVVRRLIVMASATVLLGFVFVAQAETGLFQDARGRLLGLVAPRSDPTVDAIRWDQIAAELKQRGLLDEPRTFLFTDCWRFSAELALATRQSSNVACFHRDSRSFTFWSRPEDWVGRDGVFVQVEDGAAEASNYAPWFSRIEPLATFPIIRAGVPMQTVHLYRCVQQTDPFPFGYNGPGRIPLPKKDADAELAAQRLPGDKGLESRTVR